MVNRQAAKFQNLSTLDNFVKISFLAILFFYLFLQVISNLIIWILIAVVIEYLLSVWLLSYSKLHDDYVEITYPTRLSNKRKIIKYKDVDYVLYYNVDAKSLPLIGFITTKNKRLSSSNSFACRKFERRREILKFLQSKGLDIEIKAGTSKDETILE